jgi:hypothetical protein
MRRYTLGVLVGAILLAWISCADAYVEVPYAMGRLVKESTNIILLQAEKVDNERNLIIYRKVADIKGTSAEEVVRHNIAKAGFHPREWQTVMQVVQPGKYALFFHNKSASETCIDNYWYQCYPGGEWWRMSHAEPFLLRSYAGRPERLAPLITEMLAGREVILPCMVDGDKNALQLRAARIQRLKASLAIQDYNPGRDFVGWGGDELRRILNMPGFAQVGDIGRMDPNPAGIISADINGDGQPDLCLWGEDRVSILINAGNAYEPVSLPYNGGARSAAFGDYNGDGRPDLLLATPAGLRLFTNDGGTFRDDSLALPQEQYYNLSSAVFIDQDGDGRLDVLAANGFMGLRLYRNLGDKAKPAPMTMGDWHWAGPFDNTGNRGFDTAYPPEQNVDFAASYTGRNGVKFGWKKGNFPDGQVNSFIPLLPPELHNEGVIYVCRQITLAGSLEMPVSLGSDDSLAVFVNGQRVLAENVARACAPDQNALTIRLRPGRNTILLKIGQGSGEWGFYFAVKGKLPAPVPQLFADVSDQVGLGTWGIGSDVKGNHLAVADVNNDGRQDFFYAAGQGVLALNTPSGFVLAKNTGMRAPARTIPVFGDFDGDGLPDLLLVQEGRMKLFRNAGDGRFVDITASTGDLAKFDGQATSAVFADFDNSSRLDLLIGCVHGPNRYYRNNGNGTFSESTGQIGLDRKVFNTRALCVADLNGDGVPDLAFTNEGQESAVLLSAADRLQSRR